MNKLLKLVFFLGTTTLLQSCSGSEFRNTLGLDYDSPDEFKIISNPPLSMPPDFDLRPPQKGKQRSRSNQISHETRDLLLNNNERNKSKSNKSDERILDKLGDWATDNEIRNVLHEERQAREKVESEKSKLDKLLSTIRGEESGKEESLIDASGEKKRIEENKKNDKLINEGEVKTIDQDENTLDRLFNL